MSKKLNLDIVIPADADANVANDVVKDDVDMYESLAIDTDTLVPIDQNQRKTQRAQIKNLDKIKPMSEVTNEDIRQTLDMSVYGEPKKDEELLSERVNVVYKNKPQFANVHVISSNKPPFIHRPIAYKLISVVIAIVCLIVAVVILMNYARKQSIQTSPQQSMQTPAQAPSQQPIQQTPPQSIPTQIQTPSQPIPQSIQQTLSQPISSQIQTPSSQIPTSPQQQIQTSTPVNGIEEYRSIPLKGGSNRKLPQRDAKGRFIKSK